MKTVIAAMFDIVNFNTEIRILSSAIVAKHELGLDAESDRQKRSSLQYEGATVVASMSIVGWELEPMSDDGSVAGYFDRPMSKTVSIVPQSLSTAKSTIQMQQLLDIWFESEGFKLDNLDPEEEFGSGFSSVRLLDNLGNIVAEGDAYFLGGKISWKQFSPLGETEIAKKLQRARELEHEASEEACWDNFDTARNLRERAGSLRREIAIGQNCLRLAS